MPTSKFYQAVANGKQEIMIKTRKSLLTGINVIYGQAW